MQNDKSLTFHDVPPIRLALIGAGRFTQRAIIPALLKLRAEFELVAIYSRSHQSAQAAADLIPHKVSLYDELDLLLKREDISAVGIALPIPTMPSAIKAALGAGKHVLSEKPIAPTRAEAEALLEHHAGPFWMVAENWRFAPAIQQAKALVASGELGKLALFHWAIYAGMGPDNIYYQTPWRRDNSFQGGFLLDGGIHFMAALREILGEARYVQAQTRSLRADLPPIDTLTAIVEMESGLGGTLAFSYAVGVPWSTSLTIVGEKGALEVNRDSCKLSQGQEVKSFQGEAGIEAEWRIFAEAIRGEVNPLSHPRHALGDLALLEALLDSAQKGGEKIAVLG